MRSALKLPGEVRGSVPAAETFLYILKSKIVPTEKKFCCFEVVLEIYKVDKLFCIDLYCRTKLSVIPGRQKNKNA